MLETEERRMKEERETKRQRYRESIDTLWNENTTKQTLFRPVLRFK